MIRQTFDRFLWYNEPTIKCQYMKKHCRIIPHRVESITVTRLLCVVLFDIIFPHHRQIQYISQLCKSYTFVYYNAPCILYDSTFDSFRAKTEQMAALLVPFDKKTSKNHNCFVICFLLCSCHLVLFCSILNTFFLLFTNITHNIDEMFNFDIE